MLEIQRQIRPSLYDLEFEKPRPPRAAIPLLRHPGAAGRGGRSGDAARRGGGCGRRPATEARGRGSDRGLLSPRLPQPRAREPDARNRARGVPRSGGLALLGGRSGVPRVLPGQHHPHQRGGAAHRRAVSPPESKIACAIPDSRASSLVMQSSGGVLTFEAARTKPVFMVESGPAAGVIVSAHLGDLLGFDNILSLDMGATTAKTGLVERGTPSITKEYEVGTAARAEHGAKGAGYPIRTPVIDLVRDRRGRRLHRLGWTRAACCGWAHGARGADPAPACYGKGGDRAHHHRCEPRPRPARRGSLPRRRDAARRGGGPACHQGEVRRPARSRRGRGWPSASSRSPTTPWSARSGGSRCSADTTRGTSSSWPSAAPAPRTQTDSPRSSTSPPSWSP